MSSDADTIDTTGAREVHRLLDELEGHINAPDASGGALSYQAKARIRMLQDPPVDPSDPTLSSGT
ncbi:MAG TPA: hypothetical protein VF745_00915 [Steroidobacteraceae bacterium]